MSEVGLESRDLHQALLVHAWKSEELLSIVHHPVVYDRLLQLLTWLARHFGQPIPEGILLNLRLTHQDFADTIATTRVTVTRVLNQLERNGMIERCRASEVRSHLKHEPLARQSVILKVDMASCSEAV